MPATKWPPPTTILSTFLPVPSPDDDDSEGARFRMFLLTYPSPSGEQNLRSLQAPQEWLEPLRILSGAEFSPLTEEGQALQIVLTGDVEAGMKWLLEPNNMSEDFQKQRAFWIDILTTHKKPQLSWIAHARMMVARNFAWSSVSQPAEVEYHRHKRALLRDPNRVLDVPAVVASPRTRPNRSPSLSRQISPG